MNPAATLKKLRLEAGLTQAQLADKAGLDRSWVNQMERGKKPITQSPRAKLAAALGVTQADLGAPAEEATDAGSLAALDRLESLEARVDEMAEMIADALSRLEAALERRSRRRPPSNEQIQEGR